jgi:hypothetical protein
VETVRSPEYDYFSSDQEFDFGPVITRGAVAIRHDKPAKRPLRRLTIHEVVKPGRITVRLGEMPGTTKSQRAERAWTLLTRGRRLELRLPDLLQEGDLVHVRGAEMATTLGYEVRLSEPQRA